MKVFVHLAIFAAILNGAAVIGYQLYDYETQQCCNGNVQIIKIKDEVRIYQGCCGNVTYDYNKFICCGETLKEYDQNSTDKATACCEIVEDRGNERVVVDTFFDYSTQTCCGGKLADKEDMKKNYDCCGGKVYDTEFKFCVGDQVVLRNDDAFYCGTKTYNATSHVCCSMTKKVDDKWVTEFGILPQEDGKWACCGIRMLFDLATEVCCGDKKIYPREGTISYACCGDQAYDLEKEFCCGETLHPNNNTDTQCCWPTETIFNSNTEICCGEEGVVPLTGKEIINSTACCTSDW